MAVAADGFEVGEVPGVEVEVLLAQSPLEKNYFFYFL